MTYTHHFAVLPGDARQEHLIDVLLTKGKQVAYNMSLPVLCQSAPVILGGIPFSYTYEELTLTSGQLFFGGCLSDTFLTACKENHVTAFDYMQDPALTVFNAIATAEGTVAEIASHSYFNLHQSPVLILGFGVCAKALATRLLALHMQVCICARSPLARAEAVSLGCEAIPFENLRGRLPGFLFLINTVPAPVLTEELLHFVHPECLLCDIASAPGGIDCSAAQKQDRSVLKLPGLPGRYSPKSSALFMADCIFKNLQGSGCIL